MSPTVPPISTRQISASPAPSRMQDLISSVTWGMTWDGRPEVFAAPLLAQHVPVDLAGGEVVPLPHPRADEAFVVAEVEVGLPAVGGDEHLPVLEGAHRPGVDVDVGVELDEGDAEAPRFEDRGERRGRDALPSDETTPPVMKMKRAIGTCFARPRIGPPDGRAR